MRPSHIRVFDGLRVTTEHIEHFQGSLHSAVRDLREILGLGRVFRGFEVIATGPDSFQVTPGLAFDFAGQRLVSDELLDASFERPEAPAPVFVSLQYQMVEEGQSEGRYTLIFDSVRIVQQTRAPDAEDNLVLLAQLDPIADGPGFELTDLRSMATLPTEKPAADGNGQAAEVEPVVASDEVAEPAATPAAPETEDLADQPAAQPEVTSNSVATSTETSGPAGAASVAGAPDAANETPAGLAAGAATSTHTPAQPSDAADDEESKAIPPTEEANRAAMRPPSVTQGEVRLQSTDMHGQELADTLMRTLRSHLRSDGAAADAEFSLPLTEQRIEAPAETRTLTLHTRLVAAWQAANRRPREQPVAARVARVRSLRPTAPEISETKTVTAAESSAEVLSAGEATIANGAISQFATLQHIDYEGDRAGSWSTAFTRDALVVVPVGTGVIADAAHDEAGASRLTLRISVETERNELYLLARLNWVGRVTPQLIDQLQQTGLQLNWQATVGWKAWSWSNGPTT